MECDIEDKFLRIREENLLLKKQANEANNNIKLLTTRLNRLLEMKKRTLVNEKNKKLVSLDEMLFNLQLKMGQLESENSKLRQRSLVLQTKLDAARRRQYRSMYSSVPSRTDSGLEWIDSSSNHNFNSKPSSARLTVHHRSSSTISLNRVTFNSSPSDIVHRNSSDVKFGSIHSIKPIDGQSRPFSTSKIGHQRPASGNLSHRISVNDGEFKVRGRNNFVQQLLRETQNEIVRLQEIIVLQQHYIENIQSDVNRANSEEDANDLIKTAQENGTIDTRKQTIGETTLLTVENSTSHSLHDDSIGADFNENQKSLQIFRNGLDLDKILTTKGIPNEIIVHIEKLTSELIESQNVIKSLRSQLIKDNLATVKMVEIKQKLDHLTQENEILEKSLRNCIGTCISGLEKDCLDDGDNTNRKPQDSSQYADMRIKNLQDKISQLIAENAEQAQSLKEKTQLVNLLQEKYSNLKEAYDLMISSSRSSLNMSGSTQSLASISPRSTKTESRMSSSFVYTDANIGDQINKNDESTLSNDKVQLKGNEKGTILDSLGHVREMVESAQSELENGLKLDKSQDD